MKNNIVFTPTNSAARLYIVSLIDNRMQQTRNFKLIRFYGSLGWCMKHNCNSLKFWLQNLIAFAKPYGRKKKSLNNNN